MPHGNQKPRILLRANQNFDGIDFSHFEVMKGNFSAPSKASDVLIVDEEHANNVADARTGFRLGFVIVVSNCQVLWRRAYWTKLGINAIIPNESLNHLLTLIWSSTFCPSSHERFACPYCPLDMSAAQLWHHVPLYHTQEPNSTRVCELCHARHSNWAVHLHHDHIPKHVLHKPEKRQPVFSLVVVTRVRNGIREYLVVEEAASQGWWLPGGGVDLGESMIDAAERECREEAGIRVKCVGLLRMQHFARPDHSRFSAVFLAEPIGDEYPKHIPDFESRSACWVSLADLKVSSRELKLRGPEPIKWFEYVETGQPVYPLDVYFRIP
jgi:8-oxo-dGTP pyrophosphatase MutT (NUDIX family)